MIPVSIWLAGAQTLSATSVADAGAAVVASVAAVVAWVAAVPPPDGWHAVSIPKDISAAVANAITFLIELPPFGVIFKLREAIYCYNYITKYLQAQAAPPIANQLNF
jgi:hypothetical protein